MQTSPSNNGETPSEADTVESASYIADDAFLHHLYAMFHASADHVLVTDAAGCVLYINPALTVLLHVPAENILGNCIADVTHAPEGMAEFSEAVKQVINTQQSRSLTLTIDSTVFKRVLHDAVNISAIVHPSGQRLGALVVGRDISEVIALQNAVTQKELEYADLVANIPISIVRYNLQCQRIFINAHCESEHQQFIHYYLNKTPSEAWAPTFVNMTGQDFHKLLQQVIDTGEGVYVELKNQQKEGLFTYLIHIVPEKNKQGAVVGLMTLASDITESTENLARIEHLAYHDGLTALPNRSLLSDRIRCAIASAARQQSQFGILFLDLDDFKLINDNFGHAAGDQLLVEIARRLSTCVRASDTVARMGGDEFAILAADIKNIEALEALAQHIIKQFSVPFMVDNTVMMATMSIGAVRYPIDAQHLDDLMRYADTAMYVAKKSGGNTYRLYTKALVQ